MKNKKKHNLGKITALAMLLGIAGTSNAQIWYPSGNNMYNSPLTGYVGIGTNNPGYPLTVASGSTQFATAIQLLPTTYTNGSTPSYRAAIGIDNWLILQDGNGNGNKDFDIYQGSTGLTRFSIGTNGNVGMGAANTAPWAPLTVTSPTPPNGVMEQLNTGTSMVMFTSNMCNTCYNNLAQLHDNGIIWSDGNSVNSSSGFVIAPWAGSSVGIRIAANGYVGVGISTPVAPLSVYTPTTPSTGLMEQLTNVNYNMLFVSNAVSGGYNWSTQAGDNGIFWSDGLAGGHQNSASGFMLAPWQGSHIGIRIDGASGNVTANPQSTGALVLGTCGESSTLGYAISYMGFNASRTSSGWTAYSDSYSNGGASIYGDVGGSIHFATIPSVSGSGGTSSQTISDATVLNNTIMTIKSTGQVVIGKPFAVTNPLSTASVSTPGAYTLYVAGGILTEQVRVAVVNSSTWADYVFADGYKLKPLYEVEQYLKDNKHLPEVPSSDEVQKSGIDVATMDATLLKKIEELTLYIIQLQKQNSNNTAQIQQLTEQVKVLTDKK